MMSKELLVGVIVILNFCSIEAQSPSERCDLKGGTGTVCNDCLHTVDCDDLSTLIACSGTTICDQNLADGFCVTATSEQSEICMCADDGKCLHDPNSDSGLVSCESGSLTVKDPTSCSGTAPLFNPDPGVCACEAALPCSACGFIAAYPDPQIGCSTEFIYCADGASSKLSCPGNTCFNETTCECFDPTSTPCGDCGYREVEGDSSKYVYCEDDITLPCPSGTTYDPILCVCASESATSCTTSEPATCPPCSSTGTCLPCGLEAGSTSCSEYYACDDNGRTGGPYDCPGTLCFDAVTCNCI